MGYQRVKRNDALELIAERVRTLRKQAGETQEQLAAAIGVSRNIIKNIECAQHVKVYDHISAICGHYGVSTDYLFFEYATAVSDSEKQAMCSYTGLMVEVIEKLHSFDGVLTNTVNRIIDSKLFVPLVVAVSAYRLSCSPFNIDIGHDDIEHNQFFIDAYANFKAARLDSIELFMKLMDSISNTNILNIRYEESVRMFQEYLKMEE